VHDARRVSARLALLENALRRIYLAASESLDRRPRILGITTIERGEGATLIAASLARLLAADAERVLLIDAAFDNPDLSRGVDLDGAGGLWRALHNPELIPGARHNIGLQLDFLPAGEVRGLGNARWRDLADVVVGGAARDYDWVIVDLPPLTKVVDVRAACQFIDHLLLVAEWGSSPHSAVERALRALGPGREKLLGLLLNKAPRRVFTNPRSPSSSAALSTSRDRSIADTTPRARTSP
jgi:succinoglycan biosynthesis transport protein ExoP